MGMFTDRPDNPLVPQNIFETTTTSKGKFTSRDTDGGTLGSGASDIFSGYFTRADRDSGIIDEMGRVLGRGLSGVSFGLSDLLYEVATGENVEDIMPRTTAGKVAGGILEFGSFLAGPMAVGKLGVKGGAWAIGKALGSRSLPTRAGLRWVTDVMAKGGATLGLASGLSSIIPSYLENDGMDGVAMDVLNSVGMNAAIGALFPAMGMVPTKTLRIAFTLGIMDQIRGAFGHAKIEDVYRGVVDGSIDNGQMINAVFGYAMDIYFAAKTPSMKKQLEAINNRYNRAIIDEIKSVSPEEAEQTVLDMGERRAIFEKEPVRKYTREDDLPRNFTGPAYELGKQIDKKAAIEIWEERKAINSELRSGKEISDESRSKDAMYTQYLRETVASFLGEGRDPSDRKIFTEAEIDLKLYGTAQATTYKGVNIEIRVIPGDGMDTIEAYIKGIEKQVGSVEVIKEPGGGYTAQNLTVHPNVKEKGIGTELMKTAKEQYGAMKGTSVRSEEGRGFFESKTVKDLALEQGGIFPKDAERGEKSLLKTFKESPLVSRDAKEALGSVDTEYLRVHNPEALSKADARIAMSPEGAREYVEGSAAFTAEKSATFIRLYERMDSLGQHEEATKLFLAYEYQARAAGQGIQIMSIMSKFSGKGFLRAIEADIKRSNENKGVIDKMAYWISGGKKGADFKLSEATREMILKEMSKINQITDPMVKAQETQALLSAVAKEFPPTYSEMFNAYRYQNMLSGWKTSERNIWENFLNTFFTKPAELAIEGGVDFVGSTMTGQKRAQWDTGVSTYYKSAINSLPNAWEAFKQAWSGQANLLKPELGVAQAGMLQEARMKNLPKGLTVIQRFMEGQDRFFTMMIASGHQAVLESRGVATPEAKAKAYDIAEKYLYRNQRGQEGDNNSILSKALHDIGDTMASVRNLPTIGGLAGWFIPFITVPINRAAMMIDFSPLGMIRKPSTFTTEAIAKFTFGSMVTGIGAAFAMNGQTTWTAPSDPEEKKWFYATGQKPFSVRIGDTWVPIWYMGPLALAFGLPAAVKWGFHDRKESLDSGFMANMVGTGMSMAKFIASQSSVQSMGNFFSVLSGDLSFSMPQQIGFMLGQAMPAQSLLRNIAQMADPSFRAASTITESLRANIPFLGKDLPAYVDPLGEISERDLINSFLPYDVGQDKAYFSEMFPEVEAQNKINYVKNKISKIQKQMRDGAISSDRGLSQIDEILGRVE